MVKELLLLAILVVVVGLVVAYLYTGSRDSKYRTAVKVIGSQELLITSIEQRSREMANEGDPFARSILLDIEDHHREMTRAELR